MPDSVFKVVELVGTSTVSFQDAAKAAVDMAAKSLRDLRIAEIEKLDVQIKDGKVEMYRAKLKVSFKFEGKG
jgi:flavin-binding protein dodecin